MGCGRSMNCAAWPLTPVVRSAALHRSPGVLGRPTWRELPGRPRNNKTLSTALITPLTQPTHAAAAPATWSPARTLLSARKGNPCFRRRNWRPPPQTDVAGHRPPDQPDHRSSRTSDAWVQLMLRPSKEFRPLPEKIVGGQSAIPDRLVDRLYRLPTADAADPAIFLLLAFIARRSPYCQPSRCSLQGFSPLPRARRTAPRAATCTAPR